MNRYWMIGLISILGASAPGPVSAAAGREGTLKAVRMYTLCAPTDDSCPRRHEIRRADDGYGARTSSAPITETQYPVYWNECVRNHELSICLHVDDRDIQRWNSLFGVNPPRDVAIAVGDDVISVLRIRGKFANPVVIGQMDGVRPPIDLERFLEASSAGP